MQAEIATAQGLCGSCFLASKYIIDKATNRGSSRFKVSQSSTSCGTYITSGRTSCRTSGRPSLTIAEHRKIWSDMSMEADANKTKQEHLTSPSSFNSSPSMPLHRSDGHLSFMCTSHHAIAGQDASFQESKDADAGNTRQPSIHPLGETGKRLGWAAASSPRSVLDRKSSITSTDGEDLAAELDLSQGAPVQFSLGALLQTCVNCQESAGSRCGSGSAPFLDRSSSPQQLPNEHLSAPHALPGAFASQPPLLRAMAVGGCPLELIDLARRPSAAGDVYAVRPLAAMAVWNMAEQKPLSYKIVGIAADWPQGASIASIADVKSEMPGALEAVQRWLCHSHPSTLQKGVGAPQGKAWLLDEQQVAATLVAQAHSAWLAHHHHPESTARSSTIAAMRRHGRRSSDFSAPVEAPAHAHVPPGSRTEHAQDGAGPSSSNDAGGSHAPVGARGSHGHLQRHRSYPHTPGAPTTMILGTTPQPPAASLPPPAGSHYRQQPRHQHHGLGGIRKLFGSWKATAGSQQATATATTRTTMTYNSIVPRQSSTADRQVAASWVAPFTSASSCTSTSCSSSSSSSSTGRGSQQLTGVSTGSAAGNMQGTMLRRSTWQATEVEQTDGMATPVDGSEARGEEGSKLRRAASWQPSVPEDNSIMAASGQTSQLHMTDIWRALEAQRLTGGGSAGTPGAGPVVELGPQEKLQQTGSTHSVQVLQPTGGRNGSRAAPHRQMLQRAATWQPLEAEPPAAAAVQSVISASNPTINGPGQSSSGGSLQRTSSVPTDLGSTLSSIHSPPLALPLPLPRRPPPSGALSRESIRLTRSRGWDPDASELPSAPPPPPPQGFARPPPAHSRFAPSPPLPLAAPPLPPLMATRKSTPKKASPTKSVSSTARFFQRMRSSFELAPESSERAAWSPLARTSSLPLPQAAAEEAPMPMPTPTPPPGSLAAEALAWRDTVDAVSKARAAKAAAPRKALPPNQETPRPRPSWLRSLFKASSSSSSSSNKKAIATAAPAAVDLPAPAKAPVGAPAKAARGINLNSTRYVRKCNIAEAQAQALLIWNAATVGEIEQPEGGSHALPELEEEEQEQEEAVILQQPPFSSAPMEPVLVAVPVPVLVS
eukprot:jgi/Mesen1/4809/ME000243S03992